MSTESHYTLWDAEDCEEGGPCSELIGLGMMVSVQIAASNGNNEQLNSTKNSTKTSTKKCEKKKLFAHSLTDTPYATFIYLSISTVPPQARGPKLKHVRMSHEWVIKVIKYVILFKRIISLLAKYIYSYICILQRS